MNVKFKIRYVSNKIFWSFANPIRSVYRFIVRSNGRAVKVMILKDNQHMLLVRPNYGHRLWTFPGGAVESHESFEEAAHREVQEEVALQLSSLKFMGEYHRVHDFMKVTAHAFVASPASTDFLVDGIEIKEARWFSVDNLPPDRAANVDRIVGLYKEQMISSANI
jgi:ADP-ribose pyrophosphatase YjhB (NUDIX family)